MKYFFNFANRENFTEIKIISEEKQMLKTTFKMFLLVLETMIKA